MKVIDRNVSCIEIIRFCESKIEASVYFTLPVLECVLLYITIYDFVDDLMVAPSQTKI